MRCNAVRRNAAGSAVPCALCAARLPPAPGESALISCKDRSRHGSQGVAGDCL